MNGKSMRAESQVCGEELLESRVLSSTNTRSVKDFVRLIFSTEVSG